MFPLTSGLTLLHYDVMDVMHDIVVNRIDVLRYRQGNGYAYLLEVFFHVSISISISCYANTSEWIYSLNKNNLGNFWVSVFRPNNDKSVFRRNNDKRLYWSQRFFLKPIAHAITSTDQGTSFAIKGTMSKANLSKR